MVPLGAPRHGPPYVLDKVAMVFGQMNEPPGARLRVALSGLAMAEEFRDASGKETLIFVDNVFRFTQAGSEVSALLGRMPSAVGYQPNLSACWMFQRSMSCPVESRPGKGLIVGILSNSFSSMEKLGEPVMKPFLQDVLQFVPLLRTLTLAGAQDLLTPLKIVPHVGLAAMGDFFYHFFNMGLYTLYYRVLGAWLLRQADGSADAVTAWKLKRTVEEWKFGSGLDFYDHE